MLDLRRIGGVACDYVADPLDKLLTNRTDLPTVGRPVPCDKRDQPPSTEPHLPAPTYLRSPRLPHPPTRGCRSRTGGSNTGPPDGRNTHRTQRCTDGCPVEAPSSRPCLTRTPPLQAPEVAAAATLRKFILRSFCTVEGYH